MIGFEDIIDDLLESAESEISSIHPSTWAEENRMMTSDLSAVEGLWNYYNTPYTKPIVDCLAESHPADTIAVIKGAQIGFSAGVIENGIGWIISQNPGNILFLVGHEDLVKDSAKKIDQVIDGSGIRKLIKSSIKRARNTKSGDTDGMKEFAGGYMKLGITNHKSLRNISMRYGFIDDFESMKGETKEAGATTKMIEQRFAAFAKKKKLFYISTPELKETSNIEPVYNLGDKRKWHIPCPCCNEMIILEWATHLKSDINQPAGMTWEVDEEGYLIAESVGYTCQECGNFFDDRNKMEWLNKGEYFPTCKPSRPGYYSFHISALNAPTFMYGWEHYVRDYMDIFKNGVRNEALYKTFVNLVLGETYEMVSSNISAKELQENIRGYEINIIPNKTSIIDGNGEIVMLTCACDLNGTLNDARLDWEIVAWSEGGARYSINHGSIGTFINLDKNPQLREKWTYKHGAKNSVWTEFYSIITREYQRDNSDKKMKVFIAGIDTGYMDEYAWQFIDNCSGVDVVGIKGRVKKNESSSFVDKYVDPNRDVKRFKVSRSRNNLFIVDSNKTKDDLDTDMALKWDPTLHDIQPEGFINFPQPRDGKYEYKNYFKHFEAEHKTIDEKGKYVWKKKQSNLQNHLYDCHLYNVVLKDIFSEKILKDAKVKNGNWKDVAQLIKGSV